MVRNMKNGESLKTKSLTSSNAPNFNLKYDKSDRAGSNSYAL